MNTMAINAYAKVEMDSGVAAADSHKLILMLYEGALLAISSARNQMLNKNTAAKGKSISHAIMIINEGLLASLDKKAGGDLAQNLAALYEYMSKRLLIANLKDDMAALDEVDRLLTELKDAWMTINPAASKPAQQERPRSQTAPSRPASAALTYGRM